MTVIGIARQRLRDPSSIAALAASFNPLSKGRYLANSISTTSRFMIPNQRLGRSSPDDELREGFMNVALF